MIWFIVHPIVTYIAIGQNSSQTSGKGESCRTVFTENTINNYRLASTVYTQCSIKLFLWCFHRRISFFSSSRVPSSRVPGQTPAAPAGNIHTSRLVWHHQMTGFLPATSPHLVYPQTFFKWIDFIHYFIYTSIHSSRLVWHHQMTGILYNVYLLWCFLPFC